jgi:hypothetical protein
MLGSVSKRGRWSRNLIVEALEDRRLMTNAVITVTPTAPVITGGYYNEDAKPGQVVSFTAVASGVPVPTVQWQQSFDDITFYDIPGATSPTYAFRATANQNHEYFRAVFSNQAGTAMTPGLELFLTPTPTAILTTTQPVARTVLVGDDVTFTATASGAKTVQWQVEAPGGFFTDIPGATSPSYTFPTIESEDGDLFRAVFSNAALNLSNPTNPAKLTVLTAHSGIFITQQPVAETAVAGQDVIFSANASVAATAVQWQVSTDGGYLYNDVPNQNLVNDSFIPTLSQNGDLFRAIFSNSQGAVDTTSALLTVTPAMVPPTATIIAPNVTSAGGNGEAITVVYTGTSAAINTSTIAPSNITVTGPNGPVPASVFDISTVGDSTTVTYTVTPPAGTWRSADDGNYSVTVNPGAVSDTNGLGNTGATALFKIQADTLLVVGLTASPTPNSNGQSESFTAMLTNVGPGGPAPTGSVTFYSNGVAIGTAPLAANGSATLITSNTYATQAITAAYNGDLTHPAASSGLPLQIPAPTPLAITPSLTGVLPEVAVTGEPTPITQSLSITNVSGALFHEHLTIQLYLAAGTDIDSNSILLKSTTKPFRLRNENFKTLRLKLPGIPLTVPAGTYHLVVVLQGSDGRTGTAASSQTITVTA